MEEALTDISHDLLVFANFWRNANQNAKFGRQVDALLLLFNFKQRLLRIRDFLLVVLQEIVKHLDLGLGAALFALLEVVAARGHVPTNSVDLVGTFLAIVCHHNCAIEITINIGLIFKSFKAIVNNC